ncbi:unnamed protein product, partial [Polarella glacialis]
MASPTSRDRGYGATGSWRAVHEVVDHFAALQPSAPALEDAQGAWSYAELQAASRQLAGALASKWPQVAQRAAPAPCWEEQPQAPRPVALYMERSREFFALCLAAWRLGLPVVALSQDMPDKKVEAQRNAQILEQLRPLALIARRSEASDSSAADASTQSRILEELLQEDATFVDLLE